MNLVQYFKSIYKNYPFTSILIGLFFIINIGLNVLKIQIFPFLAYGMYSEVEMPDSFQTFEIKLDGKIVDFKNDLNYASRDFVLNRLHYYKDYIDNDRRTKSDIFITNHSKLPTQIKGFKDDVLPSSTENNDFPNWLRNYLKQYYTFSKIEVSTLDLLKDKEGIIFDKKTKLF